MPNMKSLSLTVKKLWQKLHFFATDRETGQKLARCPQMEKIMGIKIISGYLVCNLYFLVLSHLRVLQWYLWFVINFSIKIP